MLTSWIGWVILVTLLCTTYVQLVAKQVELLSGADRIRRLDVYRHLFGGPPRVRWLMFRWSGFIQVMGAAISLWLFGWGATLLLTAGLAVFGISLKRIACGHAAQLLVNLEKKRSTQNERADY